LGACETGALAPQIAICLPSCKLINTDVGTPPFVDHFLEKTEDVPHLVGGLKHFLFSIIYATILPIDFHIFQDG
jgi:hypothetical protein